MSQKLLEQEFDRFLRRDETLLSDEVEASQIRGSRRRCPVELAVFQDIAAGSVFSEEEWRDWYRLVLKAFSLLGEAGFQMSLDLMTSYVDSKASCCAEERPMVKMLRQLENAGHLMRCGVSGKFVITQRGLGVVKEV